MPQAFGRAPGVARRARRHPGAGGLRRRDHLPRAVGGLHAADPQPRPAAVEPGPAARTSSRARWPSRRPRRRRRPRPPPRRCRSCAPTPRSCPRATTSPRRGSAAWPTPTPGPCPRPAAGLPRGPVPVVGGGRPALRDGAAREPRAAPHRGHPDGPRRGRRGHAAAAALRAQAGDGPAARGGRRPGRRLRAHQRGGLPDLRALQGLRHRRRVGQRRVGQLQPALVVERLRDRLRGAGHAGGRPRAPGAPRDSFALRLRRELVAEHLGVDPDDVPDDPDEVWDLMASAATALDDWYAGGPGPRGRRHLPRPKAPLQGHLGAVAATLRGVVRARRVSSARRVACAGCRRPS